MTPDGTLLLVTSADDNSLALFNVASDFQLTFNRIFINNSTIDGLNGAASVYVSPDGKYLVVTTGKGDTLIVYSLH